MKNRKEFKNVVRKKNTNFLKKIFYIFIMILFSVFIGKNTEVIRWFFGVI